MRRLSLAVTAAVACVIGLTAAAVGVTAVASPAHAAAPPQLRIMPLGDSITAGVGSPTSSSYRAPLWNMLTGAGYSVDFVGSQRSGALPDPDNEGHSGWKISDIAGIATDRVSTYRPNIVTLHLGTNDMGQNDNGGANQSWISTPARQLQVYGSKCLDAKAGGTADGTPVIIWDCSGVPNQQWAVNADGSVVGVASGKCLDATEGATANGALLELWTCNGGANQKFSR